MQWPKVLNAGLNEVDPELYDIIEKEKNRQYKVNITLATQCTLGSIPQQPANCATLCWV